MKNNFALDIIKVEQDIKNQDKSMQGEYLDKLYELADYLHSNYLGLPENVQEKNCITGDNDYLYNEFETACKKAVGIDIIVAFIMESGVKLIIHRLENAVKRGVKIRILTGSYLNITQPSALYLIKDRLGDSVDLRFYDIERKSFHPKAYMFDYGMDSDIFIGSSNISLSALTSGIEWNYRINKTKNYKDFLHFEYVFNELFNKHSIRLDDDELRRYSSSWKRPRVYDDFENAENQTKHNLKRDGRLKGEVIPIISPRGAQIEALYELNKCRAEGFDRALVVAATGLGKTYLSAFDSLKYERVLFIAHREEILKQAEDSFNKVRKNSNSGYFTGDRKDKDCSTLFATVQTLGQKKYLNESYFPKDSFDYIIIDEFHHAAAGNYTNIINYFQPKFLLGLTATPERMDNKDVFALCDYNVAYEVRLKESINKGWLVPFRYYGVFDETDYTKIDYRNGKYDETELEKALMINKRAELILRHYKKYESKRAMGFCSSRSHANYMAGYFCENGIESCAVISGTHLKYSMNRDEAVKKLKKGDIKVIFSVDMFNEGIDIPSIDLVMFLRPTESSTIFLQQLGRGLRKSIGKKYLNVLDFIGNYKRANLIPFFLCGRISSSEREGRGYMPEEDEYPEDCFVDFDFRLIDLFKRQAKEKSSIFELLKDDYFRVKEDIKKRPMRLEMFTYMDDDLYENIVKRTETNIFNNYLEFLDSKNELNEDEKKLLGTYAHKFLINLETTMMTKSYKMPLLLAFYNNGNIKLRIDAEDIYKSFQEFFRKGTNAADLLTDKGGCDYKSWGRKEYLKVAKNPIDAFLNSAKDYFYMEDNYFCLSEKLRPFIDNEWFIENFKDVIEYKTRKYYKTRLGEKFRDNLMQIKYALRDEKVNIFAMTEGGIQSEYPFQIILCKRSPIPGRRNRFLLDAKKSDSQFELSDTGRDYNNKISAMEYEHNFAAVIDCQLKIKVEKELFEKICTDGFFSIWKPEAPVKYFEGLEEGYLVLFRVYRLRGRVDESLLKKGRKGRNYYFRTDKIINTKLLNPVIDDNTFNDMKLNLINLLKENGWLIDIE